jgi:hypothetical protein
MDGWMRVCVASRPTTGDSLEGRCMARFTTKLCVMLNNVSQMHLVLRISARDRVSRAMCEHDKAELTGLQHPPLQVGQHRHCSDLWLVPRVVAARLVWPLFSLTCVSSTRPGGALLASRWGPLALNSRNPWQIRRLQATPSPRTSARPTSRPQTLNWSHALQI